MCLSTQASPRRLRALHPLDSDSVLGDFHIRDHPVKGIDIERFYAVPCQPKPLGDLSQQRVLRDNLILTAVALRTEQTVTTFPRLIGLTASATNSPPLIRYAAVAAKDNAVEEVRVFISEDAVKPRSFTFFAAVLSKLHTSTVNDGLMAFVM